MSEHTSGLDAIAHWLQQDEDELLYTPDVGHQPGLPTRRLSAEEVACTFAVPAGADYIGEQGTIPTPQWLDEPGPSQVAITVNGQVDEGAFIAPDATVVQRRTWDLGQQRVSAQAVRELEAFFRVKQGCRKAFRLSELPGAFRVDAMFGLAEPRLVRFAVDSLLSEEIVPGLFELGSVPLIEMP